MRERAKNIVPRCLLDHPGLVLRAPVICGSIRNGKSVSCRTPHLFECIPPDTCAQSASVSGATSKPVSRRTPAARCPSVPRLAAVLRCLCDHPDPALSPSSVACVTVRPRLAGFGVAFGSVQVTLRVLRPDGDVRQDIGLLVARDTAAHSAQVSRVCDPLQHVVSGRGHRFTAPDGMLIIKIF